MFEDPASATLLIQKKRMLSSPCSLDSQSKNSILPCSAKVYLTCPSCRAVGVFSITATMRNATSLTQHRPWPLPPGPWVMAQTWHDLLFAHWPVPMAALRSQIPASLEIDTFDGAAWVAVVPFRMSGVRLRGTPSVPWLSAFPELNVRTYVKRDGKPGVWFFSLDAANAVAVKIARRWFNLPYFRAEMQIQKHGDWLEYNSVRTHHGASPAELVCKYRPTAPPKSPVPGSLEHFLTERYCLYTANASGRLIRGEIHHAPWALQLAEAEFAKNSMAHAAGITLPNTPPLLHFAAGQDVIVWPPTKIT
jgi:uncharacterized protein YqjF (DUF2071 family)